MLCCTTHVSTCRTQQDLPVMSCNQSAHAATSGVVEGVVLVVSLWEWRVHRPCKARLIHVASHMKVVAHEWICGYLRVVLPFQGSHRIANLVEAWYPLIEALSPATGKRTRVASITGGSPAAAILSLPRLREMGLPANVRCSMRPCGG